MQNQIYKKRLCYVLPKYDDNIDNYYFHLYEFLEELGQHTDLAIFVEYAKSQPKIKNAKIIYSQHVITKPFNLFERFFVFLWFRLRGWKIFFIRYSYISTLISVFILRMLGGKTYYWHCELYESYGNEKRPKLNWIKWKLFDDLPFKLSMRLSNHLVTGAEEIKNSYNKCFHVPLKRIKIIPNCINTKRFLVSKNDDLRDKLGLSKDRTIIMFAHHLSIRKGADLLPSIIQNIVSIKPNVHFIVIGEGFLKKSIEDELKQNGIIEYVSLIGSVPNFKMPLYFSSSDIFIMPSRIEGFPNVILECMTSGLPFVATDVGCIKSISPKSQLPFIVPAVNIEEFNKKILELISNESTRQEIGQKNKNHVNNYDTTKILDIFLNELELKSNNSYI